MPGTLVSEAAAPAIAGATRSELELVAAARHGDGGAFQQLADRYAPRIFRVAHGITRNHEDAEDVVQETLSRAYVRLDDFRGDSKFYTWLVRITINQALMKLRQRRTRSREVSFDDAVDAAQNPLLLRIADPAPGPDAVYSRRELRLLIDSAVDQLAPESRIVFQLREFHELSLEEIARMLKLNISTVKSRLLRARLKLRDILNKYFPNGRPTGMVGAPSQA